MPTIEWRSISGFSNILVYDYLGEIDLDITWEVIDKSLPELKKEIEAIMK